MKSGLVLPSLRADVDVFYKDPSDPSAPQVLISTTRPCYECGKPLEGMTVPVPGSDFQAHASCRRNHGSSF